MRQSFNLFTKIGWKNLWAWRRRPGWPLRFALRDTFGPVVCWLLRSHDLYDAGNSTWQINGMRVAHHGPVEMACRRCCRYI